MKNFILWKAHHDDMYMTKVIYDKDIINFFN